MSAKERFNQLSPEQQQSLRNAYDKIKALPANGPRTDGQPSARHSVHHQKLVVALATIRTKGTDVGLRVAQMSGLAAHSEVQKSLKLYANRAEADGCHHIVAKAKSSAWPARFCGTLTRGNVPDSFR